MSEDICPLCKGSMMPGLTDVTFRRERSVVVVEGVPAKICEQCGESSIDSIVSQEIYELAEKEIQRGVSLEFLKYTAA